MEVADRDISWRAMWEEAQVRVLSILMKEPCKSCPLMKEQREWHWFNYASRMKKEVRRKPFMIDKIEDWLEMCRPRCKRYKVIHKPEECQYCERLHRTPQTGNLS